MSSNTVHPRDWPLADYEAQLKLQHRIRSEAGYAKGTQGAVTVAYGSAAARAGLEVLKSGGNALDAAMSTAMMQIVLTAGAPISFFGIQSLVYYEAKTGKVHCMNAEWNTVRGETDPLTIPGGFDLASPDGLKGKGPASGRTAMVGGFMKGVGAAHERFGKLPFKDLFVASIHAAETGVPVNYSTAMAYEMRADDLARLPETRATLLKPDGGIYQDGDTLKQPALAATLRAVAEQGTDHVYRGPWAQKLVDAVQADGGRMTLEDLAAYEVIWSEPLVAKIGEYELHTAPPPNGGGVAAVEAQLLSRASGLADGPHWTKSGEALRRAVQIAQMVFLDYLPPEIQQAVYPGMDLSPQARVTEAHAQALWARMEAGAMPFRFAGPKHSDDVVAIDSEGNIAAITHSSNTVLWGKTCINIDGISIPDSGSFQQAMMARVAPGERLPAPTETGVLFKDGQPLVGFASMGSGLHHRTMQALLNLTAFGMSLKDAVDTPDFFGCRMDPQTHELTMQVPKGRFPREVLEASGLPYIEIDSDKARFGSEGLWVAVRKDPVTGEIEAVSHNRNNSGAFAY
ncbi:gamma-glutamyltransferase [Pelomonas sp. KK5]|uniref:gamma-glutamyltransferase n=1 Tax=Pelomonas sp. KK5 TaxID=1855730 RepID=UPI00097C789A|nr:gamma-glutamyltransferase [Pelomonas sp. KK5]